MTQAPAKPPKAPPKSKVQSSGDDQPWYLKVSRSRYFFGALFLHVIIFFLVATLVIFPAFKPPQDDFQKTYVPPGGPPPPPPPPPDQTVQVPTTPVAPPVSTITTTAPSAVNVSIPEITATTNPTNQTKMPQKIAVKANQMDDKRLNSISRTVAAWGRDRGNVLESNGDPHNVKATFPVYLASYADGDWDCNIESHNKDGKITGGSLPNLVEKINQWSHGNITGSVVPQPLDIGGPELMAKTPPFIFFTGHKDFHLTDQEVQNLRDYLQVGGMIWGDSALAGFGSRFDVAFHREMKKVVPDLDKNFEPVDMDYDIYQKSWFSIQKLPPGMNYYAEPIQHLDIDGKLAILYTPNDYSDMFTMRIMPGDTEMAPVFEPPDPPYLFTKKVFWDNSRMFFRNYTVPSVIACDQLGMNIVAYALVRFDKDLLLAPP